MYKKSVDQFIQLFPNCNLHHFISNRIPYPHVYNTIPSGIEYTTFMNIIPYLHEYHTLPSWIRIPYPHEYNTLPSWIEYPTLMNIIPYPYEYNTLPLRMEYPTLMSCWWSTMSALLRTILILSSWPLSASIDRRNSSEISSYNKYQNTINIRIQNSQNTIDTRIQ